MAARPRLTYHDREARGYQIKAEIELIRSLRDSNTAKLRELAALGQGPYNACLASVSEGCSVYELARALDAALAAAKGGAQ